MTRIARCFIMKEQDLLSIKEFSDLTGITQSKLRYYDEIELFQPVMRADNGYRYYSAPQTIAVNSLNVMHSMNIPVRKFSSLKKERTPKQILELLQKHELELNQELYKLQQAYSIIHTYCDLIREGMQADEQAISRSWMDSAPIELGSQNDFSDGFFYDSFFRFIRQMADRNINPAFPAGGFYEDMDAFIGAPGRPTRYFVHFPEGREKREAGEYLVGYARGYYGEIGDLPQRLKSYAEENGIAVTGPVFEAYLHDEVSVGDPNQFLIQASVLIKTK